MIIGEPAQARPDLAGAADSDGSHGINRSFRPFFCGYAKVYRGQLHPSGTGLIEANS
jgi:hypothetical protein